MKYLYATTAAALLGLVEVLSFSVVRQQRQYRCDSASTVISLSKYAEGLVDETTTIPAISSGGDDVLQSSLQTILSSDDDSSSSSSISRSKVDSESSATQRQNNNISERTLGILVLLTVPLAWGTYTPVVKYMYEKMDPSMPGFVFSAGYYVVAAVSLSILSQLQVQKEDDLDKEEESNKITNIGGWELGSYLFIGNGLQVVGLQTVPADRAAFLVQLTTVIVPLLSALAAGNIFAVPTLTWAACIIAFSGVVIMGADGSETSSDTGMLPLNALHMSQGDILILLAAVAYSMHVVRLGVYAPRTTAIKLAASKATTEAALSIISLVGLLYVGNTLPSSLPEFVNNIGNEVVDYTHSISSSMVNGSLLNKESSLGVSIAAILWTGWVTCAYTIFAQSYGQQRVNPTDSNLIYTTQPLFSSLFAYFLLGEELGFYGYIGAVMIGTALWLVSSSANKSL
ncbi:hypothetical protein ACHAWC_002699 [Mediolabrus comicus]